MRTQSKKIKRVSIIFIVMIIAAVLAGGNVFALSPVAGQQGSIIVHKFSSTTEGTTTNYTGEALTNVSGFGSPLAGATFKIYKVELPALATGETLTGNNTITPASGVPTGITFEVKTATGTENRAGNLTTTELDTQTTGDTGVVTFSNVDQGYYILAETVTPGGYNPSASSVISLPLTKKDGTGFNYDINVYPKNVSNLPITKVLDNTAKTYKVGDTVNFTINGAFKNNEADPNTVFSVNDMKAGANYGQMYISDTLMKELTYNNSVLTLLKADGTSVPLTAVDDYTLTGTDTGALKWELTPAGIDKAIAAGATSVQVKLTTTIRSIATSEIKNNASSFVKKAGATVDPVTPTTPDTTVPVANIVINKTNADGSAQLANAVFVLASNAAGTSFYKADGTETTDIAQALTATTSADGAAQFSGVAFDNTADKTFYLVEKAAPAGYQLKVNPIAVTFTTEANKTSFTVNTTVKNYANGTTDPDSNKFALPMTGAMGSTFLLVTGIALMASAVVIYVTYRKKRNNG